MWFNDPNGMELDDAEAAREELRRRARLTIDAGTRQRCDLRSVRVRVRDERGTIVFEGTLDEAAACDVELFPLPVRTPATRAGVALNPDPAVTWAKVVALKREIQETILLCRAEMLISRDLVAAARRVTGNWMS